MKPRFLLIDKDDKLFSEIKELMRFKGYEIDFMNASEIRAHHELRQFSLIILGVLPSSQRIFNKLKKYASSILFVAEQRIVERHAYLTLGNYILKPVLPEALVNMIQDLIDGRPFVAPAKIEEFHMGRLAIRPTTREIRMSDRWVSIKPKTFDLLCHFVRNPNRLFTRQELIRSIWSNGLAVAQRTVDAQVKELRKKIKESGFTDGQIVTVFGKGYMFLMPA